jgi:hypothetical protein
METRDRFELKNDMIGYASPRISVDTARMMETGDRVATVDIVVFDELVLVCPSRVSSQPCFLTHLNK